MKIFLLIFALLFNVFVYFISIESTYIEEIVFISIVVFSFFHFLHLIYRSKYILLKTLVFGSCFILSLNQIFGLGAFLVYDSQFTYGHALSVLNSNLKEIQSMMSTMTILLVLFVLLMFFYFYVVKFYPIQIKNRIANIGISLLWILVPICSVLFYHSKSAVERRFSLLLSNSPFYNIRTLTQAIDQYNELHKIKNHAVDYSNLIVGDNQVKTIVLVIGESARRCNMSLYGYNRHTTPFQDQERDNMKLYTEMVSPAAITLFSVPMLLSSVVPEKFQDSKGQFGDNILCMAHHLGYSTYWLSTQEQGSRYLSTVSNMAQLADSAIWCIGYDEVLIDKVREIQRRDLGKKMLVLHINGSHSNACDKYPADQSFFKGDNPVVDCYDNSIRYTDAILGQLFAMLRNENSALVYLSDHAEKLTENRFIHSDSKEGTAIPYYAWYSPLCPEEVKDIGVHNGLTSLIVNYYEVARLLGVTNIMFERSSEIKFLKSDLSVVDYDNLMP